MDETFLLSNIAPQVGVGFNRHCSCFSRVRSGYVITRLARRLGLPRRLVSSVDEDIFRRLRVHYPIVSPTQGHGWEIAGGEWAHLKSSVRHHVHDPHIKTYEVI